MLQQTPVKRVVNKYIQFIINFPDFPSLAKSSLSKILKVWYGLGYNRRVLALKQIAEIVVNKFDGILPSNPEILLTFPGIGRYTASAICTFAFNLPTVFIETNIRTVFIHYFFHNQSKVKDKDVLPLVEKTLDMSNPREWYFALMDYGWMLKRKCVNPTRRSSSYHKQPPFKGSDRQIRGMILKILIHKNGVSEREVVHQLTIDPKKVKKNLIRLQDEGFIRKEEDRFVIA